MNALAAIEWAGSVLVWGVQQRRVRMWAAADRNIDVAAAAAEVDDDDDDDDDETAAASTKAESEPNITHNRSASEGEATASACSKSRDNGTGGGRMDVQGSARAGDEACASRIAVAMQMQPMVT